MANFIIKKTTAYLSYIISYSLWNEILSNKTKKIGSSFMFNIKKYDIIFFYEKGKGFVGILQALSDQKLNLKKIIIWKNDNLNKYCFDYNTFVALDAKVKVSEIINTIKSDMVGYKNTVSFCNKQLAGMYTLVPLDNTKGKLLLTKLIELGISADADEAEGNTENDSEGNTENDSEGNTENDSEGYTENDSEGNTEDNSEDDSEDNTEDDSGSTNSVSSPEEEHVITKGRINMIPIMVLPCKNLVLPNCTKKRAKYIRNHMRMCLSCNVINNNNLDLSTCFNKDCILEYALVDDIEPQCYDGIEAYHALEPYFPHSHKYEPFDVIRFLYIDTDEVYEDCILILWAKYFI